jgi:hypothetical protein
MRVALLIVRQGWLLDPGEAFVVDVPQSLDRIGGREGLGCNPP